MENSRFVVVDGPRKQPSLTFFSLSTCSMCKKAQEYLKEKGYAYRYLLVDQLTQEEKSRLKDDLWRRCGVRIVFPALVIDDRRFVPGFFRKAWDEALGEHDGQACG